MKMSSLVIPLLFEVLMVARREGSQGVRHIQKLGRIRPRTQGTTHPVRQHASTPQASRTEQLSEEWTGGPSDGAYWWIMKFRRRVGVLHNTHHHHDTSTPPRPLHLPADQDVLEVELRSLFPGYYILSYHIILPFPQHLIPIFLSILIL